MTREELDAELQKGVDSIKAGKVYSADEVDEKEKCLYYFHSGLHGLGQ